MALIYDCCYLLNELDLLEIRLNILDPYVDKFVILESTETFSGVLKKLTFDKERFTKWQDKIIYVVCDNYPEDDVIYEMAFKSPNTGNKEDKWMREFYQKEWLRNVLTQLDDHDLVFISDVDEIWNPKILPLMIGDDIYKPKQLPYISYLNQRTDEDWNGWTGTVGTKYKNIKNACINHLRTDELTKYTVLENGGWHFCTLTGREQKQKDWASPGYDTFSDEVWKRRNKNARIEELDLPEYIMYNKEKYGKYFKNS